MTFEVGDRVRDIAAGFGVGTVVTNPTDNYVKVRFDIWEPHYDDSEEPDCHGREIGTLELVERSSPFPRSDNVNPNHYKFPGGAEVKDISGHLTSFGGQALQYIARATRLDGNNKGEAVEDLKKALRFVQWEIERLEAQ